MKKPQKYFYSHLVSDGILEAELDLLDVSPAEKEELIMLSHIHVHQIVMDAILSQLTESDKKRFLELVAQGEDEKIWKHLNEKVENIEDKIKSAAKLIKEEMRKDIKKIKATKD